MAPGTKRNRATFRRDRDLPANFAPEPRRDLPQQPDWLTPAGLEVWLDNISAVAASGMATDLDSAAFGNFCNLQGAIRLAWRDGSVPPVTAIAEFRRMAEMFGLAGPVSRQSGGMTRA